MTATSSAAPGPFDRELEIARDIALAAAAVVRSYTGTKLAVMAKAGDEPVTEADHAANTLIVARLAHEFPLDAILSEELPDDGSAWGRSASGWWIPSMARATSSSGTSGSRS